MPEQNQTTDAPGGDDQTTTQPPTGEQAAQTTTPPKVEVKDGAILIDGKKHVKESDLIAAKESLQRQMDEAQQTHNDAIDKLSLGVSEANQKLAQANAALEEAKVARATGDTSDEEVSRIKQEAEDAKTSATNATTTALDYRRKFIMSAYNIPADSEQGQKLLEKDMTQLDSFEEALKALSTSRGGPGNYVVGGGGGGATPRTEMERASELIANTPIRGVRNESSNQT